MTYQRIGARNLRRLLSRGSPLVGVGDRYRPADALPIRLTPAAAATFDGEPWFDPGALRRTVGPLYPLYREPGRHVVAILAEQARAQPLISFPPCASAFSPAVTFPPFPG